MGVGGRARVGGWVGGTIYATKPEFEQYKDRLDFINITEIGEAQAMMEMVRHE